MMKPTGYIQKGGVAPDRDQHRDAPEAAQYLRVGEGHQKANPHPRGRLFAVLYTFV